MDRIIVLPWIPDPLSCPSVWALGKGANIKRRKPIFREANRRTGIRYRGLIAKLNQRSETRRQGSTSVTLWRVSDRHSALLYFFLVFSFTFPFQPSNCYFFNWRVKGKESERKTSHGLIKGLHKKSMYPLGYLSYSLSILCISPTGTKDFLSNPCISVGLSFSLTFPLSHSMDQSKESLTIEWESGGKRERKVPSIKETWGHYV